MLALIIGFTFSMAIDRHDQREIFEEGEANAIGTEYLRADLLPPKASAATKDLLIQYIDQRILFYSKQSPEKIQEIRSKTDQLQMALWNEILPVVRTKDTPAIALVASGMNDVLNSQGYVQAAWWNRIPYTAWALMAAIAVCANLLVGFGARNFQKNTALFMIFPFVVSVSFFLIADIDSPRGGVIRIEAKNLVALKNNLTQQMEKAQPSVGIK
ncbi:hypothetical protein ICN10_07665 [Polynucleobacter sp. 86C-FISCH]|nr:hypothetical protein [Polynucleobacter sp. 86C-FISCH]